MSRRFADANHLTLPNYRPDDPISYMCYLDANSLYTTCQSFSLPVGNFRFLTKSEIHAFDVNSVRDQSDRGYILKVDLKYPEHLHDSHWAYPLCPEHLTVEASMMSPETGVVFVRSPKNRQSLTSKEQQANNKMSVKIVNNKLRSER